MYERAEQRIAEILKNEVEAELSKIGLLFRVFARAKSKQSRELKLSNKQYGIYDHDKKMQDLYGVRVALYFPDDSELAQQLLKSKYTYEAKASTIDVPNDATFGPTRCNLIFRLPQDHSQQSAVLQAEQRIDNTFEVQFRTVFSEGWHEIDHDLRYKCKEDWRNYKDHDRALNGFIATLETCDWAIIKLFEDLAWRHYKSKEWLPMMRTKFRLRWQSQELNENIQNLFNQDNKLAKMIFRIDRHELLTKLVESKIDLPLTPSNLVFICNHFYIKSADITKLAPLPVTNELNEQYA
jgi:ppGpp synthetase/RelA/SpoT-type nucleotidyltranferase